VSSLSGPVARIDLGALVHNFREVERLVGPGVGVLAMVKADAYGHGAVAVTRALLRASCRVFGTATVGEAARLKDGAPLPADARVVIFGGIPPSEARQAAVIGAEVATHDADVVRALGEAGAALGRDVAVHVKVDTGMHRLGVDPRDVTAFVDMISATRGVRAVALCSHFAMAESVTTDVTAGQLDRLVEACRTVERTGGRLPAHLANSAGIMTRTESHLDMVRPGLMLYGLYPDATLRSRADLRPVMTVFAPVVRVAAVPAGDGIGYGHTFRAPANMKVATLRCGYADGYPRALSNRGQVVLSNGRAPVVGRVCMDHTMVDVTALGDVRSGDVATLWGPALGAEEVAAACDTISYEIVARVGARVAREYVGG
jgi:alanine racemase